MAQYQVTTNKGEQYQTHAHNGILVGDAIELAMRAFLCPLRSIARVESVVDSDDGYSGMIHYDAKGNAYDFSDLKRLHGACRKAIPVERPALSRAELEALGYEFNENIHTRPGSFAVRAPGFPSGNGFGRRLRGERIDDCAATEADAVEAANDYHVNGWYAK